MRRRDFIRLCGGAVALAGLRPFAARAQQTRVRRIGFLMALPEHDPAAQGEIDALQQGLRQAGWTAGSNVTIDYRWPGSDVDRVGVAAAELVALRPDLLIARSTPSTAALLRETRTIPIVFVQVAEPIGSGFVASLARPGGNVTGFTNFELSIGGKWLELLKEVSPGLKRVGFMYNPQTAPFAGLFITSSEAAARSLGIEGIAKPVQSATDIDAVLDTLGREANAGLVCIPDTSNTSHRDVIIAAAARNRVPAVYAFNDFARAGGLMVYAVDTTDLLRRAGGYADRIFKGASPAELPVQQPTKFTLAVNLKTAKALGLDVPQSVLVRADDVIE